MEIITRELRAVCLWNYCMQIIIIGDGIVHRHISYNDNTAHWAFSADAPPTHTQYDLSMLTVSTYSLLIIMVNLVVLRQTVRSSFIYRFNIRPADISTSCSSFIHQDCSILNDISYLQLEHCLVRYLCLPCTGK